MYSFLYLIEQPCLAALKKTLEINVIQISTWITLALLCVKCVHFSWLIFSGIWLVARNRCVPTFVPYDKSNQNNNMENVQIQVSYRVCVSLFVFCNVFFWINSERQQRTATNGDPYMPSQLRMRHKKKKQIHQTSHFSHINVNSYHNRIHIYYIVQLHFGTCSFSVIFSVFVSRVM